jgi:hypothetical protein
MPLSPYVQRYGNALSPNMVDFMRVRSKAVGLRFLTITLIVLSCISEKS